MKTRLAIVSLLSACGAASAQYSDNFDRADGPIGANWTATPATATWVVQGNHGHHTSTGVNDIIQYSAASGNYAQSVSQLDVFSSATINQFSAIIIGLGGTDSIMVKIQDQEASPVGFNNIGIYHRTSATAWGAWTGTGTGFATLTAPFVAGRLKVYFSDADTLVAEIDTDFNGTPDQTYTKTGVSALAPNLGTGYGVAAWGAASDFDNWSVTGFNPNATGACCFSDGTCTFITLANCQAGAGTFSGENVTCAAANCPQPGACCMNDGTCTFGMQPACTAAGGVFSAGVTCGAANCAQAGACCFFDGTCTMVVPAACATQGGTSHAGACGSGTCPTYQIVSNLPGTFTDIGPTGTLITTGDDSSVLFTSSVTNDLVPSSGLYACTNGFITGALFTTFTNTALPAAINARGLFPFWDDLYADPAQNGAVLHEARTENGVNVEIVQWNNVRTYASGSGSATGIFEVKIFATGNIRAQYIYQDIAYTGTASGDGVSATVGYQASNAANSFLQWSFNTAGSVTSGTVLSIVPVGGAVCYANCDASTQPPILNVGDFTCFLQKFAANDPYANCDSSTQPPVLNVGDFTCFLQKFAAGCP